MSSARWPEPWPSENLDLDDPPPPWMDDIVWAEVSEA